MGSILGKRGKALLVATVIALVVLNAGFLMRDFLGALFTGSKETTVETVGRMQISRSGKLIELKAEALPSGKADQLKALPNVVGVHKYLYIASKPYDIVGIEPGAPLRLDGAVAKIRAGRGFEAADDLAAIPDRRVNSDDYIQSSMPGMFHSFTVGESFVVQGERLRVVGVYEAPQKSLEERVFLPLKTAQRLFNTGDRLTRIVVEADSADAAERLVPEIKRLIPRG